MTRINYPILPTVGNILPKKTKNRSNIVNFSDDEYTQKHKHHVNPTKTYILVCKTWLILHRLFPHWRSAPLLKTMYIQSVNHNNKTTFIFVTRKPHAICKQLAPDQTVHASTGHPDQMCSLPMRNDQSTQCLHTT